MKKKQSIILIIGILILLFTHVHVKAQNNANSPYTRFGYGQLEDDCFSKSQAMGGASIGIRSKNTINPNNPASYSSLDSTSFIFEMGVSGLISNFTSGKLSNTKFNGNLDYIALQSPITKWLGISAGLIPYSYVGYNYHFSDSLQIPGDNTYNRYTQSYYGSGGISQVYLGLSFDIAKHFSIGANGYYMFGTTNNYKAISYQKSDLLTTNTIKNSSLSINNFNVRFGLQYHETIGTKHAFVIGAIYEFKSKMNGEYTESTTGTDTLNISTNELFEMPSLYGGGITYTYDNRVTIAADFTYQEFSKARYFGKTDSLNNKIKVAIGAEYTHNPMGRRYIDRMSWRLGANYRNSYIDVLGKPTNDFSLTCGLGLPLRSSKTVINVNFEYGHIGAYSTSSLKENYFKIGVNFSLNEIWFVKAKIR